MKGEAGMSGLSLFCGANRAGIRSRRRRGDRVAKFFCECVHIVVALPSLRRRSHSALRRVPLRKPMRLEIGASPKPLGADRRALAARAGKLP
jgi:hypothetical protein